MEEYGNTLILGYWHYADIKDLHHRSRMWLSKIVFWKDELHFMEELINDHLIFFMDKQRSEENILVMDKVTKSFSLDLNLLEKKVQHHERDLKKVVLEGSKELEKHYRKDHGVLEEKIEHFANDYYQTRRQYFKLVTEIIRAEKTLKLIRSLT